MSQEHGPESGITANTLWPATVVESYASINFKLGDPEMWRKATIMSDSVLAIVSEDSTFSGHQLIDDTYLLTRGYTQEDLVQYRCCPALTVLYAVRPSPWRRCTVHSVLCRYDPNVEPPRALDPMGKDDKYTQK